MEDYKALAEFHYRNVTAHPAPIKIFALKRTDDELAGVIVYSYPPPQVFGRRLALGKTLSIYELNKEVANISRVVLHPKYRSIGLGAHLVRETLPLCGRRYVETMAVMAQYNPFFEKAGMKKITERQPDESVLEAIRSLEQLGFKPYLLSSQQANINMLNTLSEAELRKMKKIILQIKTVYIKRLRSTAVMFLKKEEFKKWLKESPNDILAKVLARIAVLAEKKTYLFWTSAQV
jgi:ABC-type ATPase with predicted acetyltransferase domain